MFLGITINREQVCREEIRPVPKPECSYNEHLNPHIVYRSATNFHFGTQDAARRGGFYHNSYMPYETIQTLAVPGKQAV